MSTFAERLAQIMTIQGITQAQLARETGASKATVSKWLNKGAIPESRFMQRITQILNTSTTWLLDGRDSPHIRTSDGTIAVLTPEEITQAFTFDAFAIVKEFKKIAWNKHDDAVALQVTGDTMASPGFPSLPEGSYAIVAPAETAAHGEIVVATYNGGAASIKKLQADGSRRYLVPLNPKYDPEEITSNHKIIGVVLEVVQRLY